MACCRAGHDEDVLRRPRDDYTRMLTARCRASRRPCVRRSRRADRVADRETEQTYVSRLLEKRRVVEAAKDVNLTVRRGETLGVVGESGSGKSTVARCIARLIEPTQGAILIEGATSPGSRRARCARIAKRVQIVFQDPIVRSIRAARSATRSSRARSIRMSQNDAIARRKTCAAGRLDGEALSRFPHQSSGGQRQAHLHRTCARDGPGNPRGR